MNSVKSPYKSKKREEQKVRLLEMRAEVMRAREGMLLGHEPNKVPTGTILFSEHHNLVRNLNLATGFNKKELHRLYGRDFRLVRRCIDDFWIIISRYTLALYQWAEVEPHPMQEMLFSCLYKSLLSLHVCLKLTTDGLFSFGRPHLRHVFESLIVAKFCAIDASTEVYDRWADGLDVYLTDAIFKKIIRPSTTEFSDIWKILSKYSHATVFAGQVGFTIEETKEGANLNLGLIMIFMQWMYHLTYRHMITRTMQYYGDYYASTKHAERARTRLRQAFQSQKMRLTPASIRLNRHYCASWKIIGGSVRS